MPIVNVKQNVRLEKPVPRMDEKLMAPGKYEVTAETIFVVSVHLSQNKEGRWVVLTAPVRGCESHEVVFRMWTYNEMVELRKLATTYDPQKRIHMIDNDLLNRLKVQKLVVSWTFGRDNPRLMLSHVNGVLTDEGWVAFTKLQPNIITHIFDEMNKILELGL